MKYQNIIKDTIILEATHKVLRLRAAGMKLREAVKKVSDDLEMTNDETRQLLGNLKSNNAQEEHPLIKEIDPMYNCIFFSSAEDSDQAAGILMYKSIPWKQKNSRDGEHFIEFNNKEMLDNAHEALKRRWSFLNKEEKTVATIEFDNLSDYEKVIDFMKKQNMVIEFKEPNIELSEDSDEIKNKRNKPPKSKNNFVAIKKENSDMDVNVWDNKHQRSTKVRKRWK